MGRTQGVKDTKKRKATSRTSSHKAQIGKSVAETNAKKEAEEAMKTKERWNQQFAAGIHHPDATILVRS